MKIDLKARYQTMDEVVADLEDYQVTVDPPGRGSSEPTPASTVRCSMTPRRKTSSSSPTSFSRPPSWRRAGPHQPRPKPRPQPRKNILCVEAQAEIQDAFRKNLSRMGYRVILVGDAERAAERYREAPRRRDLRRRRPGPRSPRRAHRHARQGPGGRPYPLAALVLLGPGKSALKEKLPRTTG